MTRTEFSAWCKTVHLLDGATGSMLRRAGMPAGVCSETWILDHPQTLIALQRAYLAAGSEIIYAPTFGANRVLLGHHDLQREVRALNRGRGHVRAARGRHDHDRPARHPRR